MAQFERSIVWLRRDLRLSDHRALFEACSRSNEVLPVFIIDENILEGLKKDNRQVEFIQGCLNELESELAERGSRLLVVRGKPLEVLPQLVKKYSVNAVFFSHDYEPSAKLRDQAMMSALKKMGVHSESFKDQVIFESREILGGSGEPYKVFTPYARNWVKTLELNKAEHLREYKPNLKKLISADQVSGKNAHFADLGFTKAFLFVEPGEKVARK